VVLIRAHDSLAKLSLMETLLKDSSHIPTSDIPFLRLGRCGSQTRKATFLDSDGKRQLCGIVADYVNGPLGNVESRNKTMEIN
jgi:hypothetical protein